MREGTPAGEQILSKIRYGGCRRRSQGAHGLSRFLVEFRVDYDRDRFGEDCGQAVVLWIDGRTGLYADDMTDHRTAGKTGARTDQRHIERHRLRSTHQREFAVDLAVSRIKLVKRARDEGRGRVF